MILKEYNIELDLKMKAFNCYAFFTSGDAGVNALNLSVLDDQEPVDLSSVMYATINFKRPDGTFVLYKNVDIINAQTGQLKYLMGTTELEQEGRVYATVSFYGNDGQRLTSTAFYFNVVQALDSDDAVESTTEYTLLTKLIEEVNAMTPPQFHFGNGLPDVLLGEDFDYYLDMEALQVYKRENGEWSYLSNFIGNATPTIDGFFSKEDKIALDGFVSLGFDLGDKEVLDALNLQMTTWKPVVESIVTDVEVLKETTEVQGTNIADLQTKTNNASIDVSNLQQMSQTQATDITELDTLTEGLVTDVTELQRDVAVLEQTTGILVTDVSELDVITGELIADVTALETTASTLTEDVSGLKLKTDIMAEDIVSLENATALIEADVTALENKTETVIENLSVNPANPKVGQIWMLI